MRWLAILLVALSPALAHAWEPTGVRVCGAPRDQQMPLVCSDGAGGAFVVWGDNRDEAANLTDTYLQHVTAEGAIAAGWPVDGLALATGPTLQYPVSLIPDGEGGVLVLIESYWTDPGDVYLQRVTSTGQFAPGWPVGGVAVATAPGAQISASLALDGAAGAFVSWYDRRVPSHGAGFLTRVLGDGSFAPGWSQDGAPFEPASAWSVGPPLMLPVASGGFLACWSVVEDSVAVLPAIRAQKYDRDAEQDPAWPVEGVVVCSPRRLGGVPADRLAPDGTGGFFTLWVDYRNSPGDYDETDVYAQHVLGSGSLAAGWPADGLPLAALAGVTQDQPSLCEDGLGGMYAAWMDFRDGYAQVFAQHLGPGGQPWPGWPAGGLHVGAELTWQLSPHVVPDGAGGVYLVWNDFVSSGYHTIVQHLLPTGAPYPGWPPAGVSATSPQTDEYRPAICSDGAGGAIVAWEDARTPIYRPDIYAQRFVRDGIVAASVSLVSAEAAPTEVRLVWSVSGARSASVERRGEGEAWEARATLDTDGEGRLEFTDDAVVPGARYEYRLAFADGTTGGLASVAVPLVYALALEGARPNPARGALQVAFTLPDAGPSQLALYDLAGRRLAARDVSAHGVGRHVVRLDDGGLAPGLYWATLTHGGRTLRTRVAVVR